MAMSLIRIPFVALALVTSLHLTAGAEPPDKAFVQLELRRAEKNPAPGLVEAQIVGSKDKVYLHKKVEAGNAEVAKAFATPAEKGKWSIAIGFTEKGAQSMAKVSEEHRGKLLAIMVNGRVITAPTIRSKITKYAMISGDFTKEEARKIAAGIKAQ